MSGIQIILEISEIEFKTRCISVPALLVVVADEELLVEQTLVVCMFTLLHLFFGETSCFIPCASSSSRVREKRTDTHHHRASGS